MPHLPGPAPHPVAGLSGPDKRVQGLIQGIQAQVGELVLLREIAAHGGGAGVLDDLVHPAVGAVGAAHRQGHGLVAVRRVGRPEGEVGALVDPGG